MLINRAQSLSKFHFDTDDKYIHYGFLSDLIEIGHVEAAEWCYNIDTYVHVGQGMCNVRP